MKNLRELHNNFLGECQYSAGLRSETLRGYAASFDLFIKLLPEAKISSLTPELMANFFKHLKTRKRILLNGEERTGIKNSTLATYRNKLHKFFKWLKERGHIKNDPFLGVPYPEVTYTDRKYLYTEDINKIFAAITHTIDWNSQIVKSRNIAIYSVLLYAGLRKGELINLRMTDINLEKGTLFVNGETSKSKIDREVPLNSSAVIALKDYFRERRRGQYTTPYLWVPENKDARFTINGFKHLNQKVSAMSGVTFHPHQFRHTFAINMLHNGADAYKIKRLLGHKDIRMTEAYLRCLPTSSLVPDVEKLRLDRLV